MLEDANGRQEATIRSRLVGKHMIGEMEKGFNSLANQAMASPEFSKGRQSGGRGHGGRAKAARRAHGKVSPQHEPAEPGADGQHGRAAGLD